ncbi:MAG: hypothetical protein BroJett018_26440 [Chloroflexota bacterium]|nr:MAG: hypothetical protein BroJett018_26440 [Chloroflexota bacterium]
MKQWPEHVRPLTIGFGVGGDRAEYRIGVCGGQIQPNRKKHRVPLFGPPNEVEGKDISRAENKRLWNNANDKGRQHDLG